MKFKANGEKLDGPLVVPHAGTWIEIHIGKLLYSICAVVPHAGTWIEIVNKVENSRELSSFPTRERGLKLLWRCVRDRFTAVVPHAGTWIEILVTTMFAFATESFPTRERGLKSKKESEISQVFLSFPTRERGLKYLVNYSPASTIMSFPTRERGLK